MRRIRAPFAALLVAGLGATGLVTGIIVAGSSAAPAQPRFPAQVLVTTTKPPTTTATTKPATTVAATTTVKPVPTTARPTTTAASTTSTSSTVVTIPGGGPPAVTAPPSTIPIETHQSNGHVSPVFPILGAAGLVVVLAMMAVQWVLTRPGRQREWTL